MYFTATYVLLFGSLLTFISAWAQELFSHIGKENTSRNESRGISGWGLLLLLAFAATWPTASSMLDANRFNQGDAITFSGGMMNVIISLLASLVLVLIYVYKTYRYVMKRDAGPRIYWFPLAAVMTTIIFIAAASQLAFSARQDAGMVSFDYFRDDVQDMHCDANLLPAAWDGNPDHPVRYRCPSGPLLNSLTRVPFAPWPNYNAGESLDLAKAMYALRKKAEANMASHGIAQQD